MTKMYLLTLDYPAVDFPVRLFATVCEALQFAADNPPPHADDLHADDLRAPKPGVLQAAYSNTAPAFEDYGQEANRKPNGYTIQEYEDGVPTRWAMIEPYSNLRAELPSEPGKIDTNQRLVWH